MDLEGGTDEAEESFAPYGGRGMVRRDAQSWPGYWELSLAEYASESSYDAEPATISSSLETHVPGSVFASPLDDVLIDPATQLPIVAGHFLVREATPAAVPALGPISLGVLAMLLGLRGFGSATRQRR